MSKRIETIASIGLRSRGGRVKLATAGGATLGKDTYQVLKPYEGTTIQNRTKFKFACCDCGLVHWILIHAPTLRRGRELGLATARDRRATTTRRKLLGIGPKAKKRT